MGGREREGSGERTITQRDWLPSWLGEVMVINVDKSIVDHVE